MKPARLSYCPFALLLSALIVSPGEVRAQNARVPAPTRSEAYLLGPGDVLRVTVAGFPEYSQDVVTVPPDGVVSLARIGSVRLSGRTRAAVQSEIRQKLIARVRLRNPQVAVALTAVRPDVVGSVTVISEVPRGGNFPIRQGHRLSDLLAEVGLSERLEERRATLVRGKTRLALDLRSAAAQPGSSADVRLRPGDSIAVRVIPAGKITLDGDVSRPGVYELHRVPRPDALEVGLAPRLSDLITRAGGLKTDEGNASGGAPANGMGSAGASPIEGGNGASSTLGVALPSQSTRRLITSYTATLQRSGRREPISLNVEAATNDIAGPENIYLRAGDFVSIRQVRPITVYLDGASTKTGSFQLSRGAGVLELLVLAGPLTRLPGDLRASIRRGDETIPLNLPALLLSSDSGANQRLQNGDIVQLREPETLSVSVAGQVTNPGSVKVRPGATIFEAVSAAGGIAGGVSVESARLNVLRRENDGSQRVYSANAAGILGLTDVRTNLVLREGDIVNIARGEDQTVFVSGQVANPGSFQVLPGEGLAQIITRAGGPKEDAALTQIRVTRRGQMQTVDAFDAVKNGRPLAFALQAGDIVSVPVNPNQVLALEAFTKPGFYTIPERGKLTLVDFLGQAPPTSGVKRLYILKANADGTIDTDSEAAREARRRPINVNDLRRGRQPNIVLAPRDVIIAESPIIKRNWLDNLGALGMIRFMIPGL